MIDYYKTSLQLLHRLLKESGIETWAKWIEQDILFWDQTHSVSHHLAAYQGMGSLMDVSLSIGQETDVWKSKVFDMAKKLAKGLAKGTIKRPPLDEAYYRSASETLKGSKCKHCGHAWVDKVEAESYLSSRFLPKLTVDLLRKDNFMELGNVEKWSQDEAIIQKRKTLEESLKSSKIAFATGNQGHWKCPICGNRDIAAISWHFDI